MAELEATPWRWSTESNGCVESYRVFSFDPGISKMESYISEDDLTIVYQILSDTPNSITMQILDEDRLLPDGTPVVWELRFGGTGAICWHRTDWPLLNCTAPLSRCETTDLGS